MDPRNTPAFDEDRNVKELASQFQKPTCHFSNNEVILPVASAKEWLAEAFFFKVSTETKGDVKWRGLRIISLGKRNCL